MRKGDPIFVRWCSLLAISVEIYLVGWNIMRTEYIWLSERWKFVTSYRLDHCIHLIYPIGVACYADFAFTRLYHTNCLVLARWSLLCRKYRSAKITDVMGTRKTKGCCWARQDIKYFAANCPLVTYRYYYMHKCGALVLIFARAYTVGAELRLQILYALYLSLKLNETLHVIYDPLRNASINVFLFWNIPLSNSHWDLRFASLLLS